MRGRRGNQRADEWKERFGEDGGKAQMGLIGRAGIKVKETIIEKRGGREEVGEGIRSLVNILVASAGSLQEYSLSQY